MRKYKTWRARLDSLGSFDVWSSFVEAQKEYKLNKVKQSKHKYYSNTKRLKRIEFFCTSHYINCFTNLSTFGYCISFQSTLYKYESNISSSQISKQNFYSTHCSYISKNAERHKSLRIVYRSRKLGQYFGLCPLVYYLHYLWGQ